MRPVIGVTAYAQEARWGVWQAEAVLTPMSYVRAVEGAGGAPIVVPSSQDPADEVVSLLDGLLLIGGSDIDPALYGAPAHAQTGPVYPDRDRAEAMLARIALSDGLPVLGVCRGMQLLNVVVGGDLVQHLPDIVADDVHVQAPGVFVRHPVHVAPDSFLARIVGVDAKVSSHHHQAPGRIGEGFREVAWAQDGTVEGIEASGHPFALGLLWHPEEDEASKLFEALVGAARGYRATRA